VRLQPQNSLIMLFSLVLEYCEVLGRLLIVRVSVRVKIRVLSGAR